MREDPGGGVGGVQDNATFPRSAWGEALTVGGVGASIILGHNNEIQNDIVNCIPGNII